MSLTIRRPRKGETTHALIGELGLRGIGIVLGVATTFLLARSVTVAELGFYSLWATIAGVVSTIVENATRPLFLADYSEARDPRSLSLYLGQRVLFVAVAVPVLTVVMLVVSNRQSWGAGALIVGTLVLTPFTAASVVLHAHTRGDLVGLVVLVQSVVWAVGLGLVYVLHLGLWGVAAALLLSNAAMSVETWRRASFFAPIRFKLGVWHPRLGAKSSVPLMALASIIMLIGWKLDLPIIYAVLGSYRAGLYSAAYKILDQMMILPTLLTSLIIPQIRAKAGGAPSRRASIAGAIASAASVAALTVCIGGSIILRLLFGPDYQVAATALSILMAALPLIVLRFLVASYLAERAATGPYLALAVTYLVAASAGTAVLTPTLGLVGAALATLLAEAFFLSASMITSVGREVLIRRHRSTIVGCVAVSAVISMYAGIAA